jgi:hypothetical protein
MTTTSENGVKRQFPRFFDRTVQTGATRDGDGEEDGGEILWADSSHDRGRSVLVSVAIVSLNENERTRERESERASWSAFPSDSFPS